MSIIEIYLKISIQKYIQSLKFIVCFVIVEKLKVKSLSIKIGLTLFIKLYSLISFCTKLRIRGEKSYILLSNLIFLIRGFKLRAKFV